jgi:hypothetical protein
MQKDTPHTVKPRAPRLSTDTGFRRDEFECSFRFLEERTRSFCPILAPPPSRFLGLTRRGCGEADGKQSGYL